MLTTVKPATCFEQPIIEKAVCSLKTVDSLMQLKCIAEGSHNSFLYYFFICNNAIYSSFQWPFYPGLTVNIASILRLVG